MRPDEIVTAWKQAADKYEQIKILADLESCAPYDIAELLRLYGCTGVPEVLKPGMKKAEKCKAIQELHGEGKTNKEIAIAMDITPQTVRNYLARLNLTANTAPRSSPVLAKYARCVTELNRDGLNDAEIGEALGLHRATASRMRRELGLPVVKSKRSHGRPV